MKTNPSLLMLCLTTTLLFSGCAYTPISIPELPDTVAVKQDCPVVATDTSSSRLDMPDPIPKNAIIEIKDGMIINLDRGGEQLIRQYAATRKAIRKMWPN